jgi:Zn-dependent M28 family amino/carboxypeptidase
LLLHNASGAAPVAPEALALHVTELAGVIGERNVFRPQAYAEAADYIQSTWRGLGYDVSEQEYDVHGNRCVNLEATRIGTRPGQVLLIGAHYDSVRGSPGANDNASGVAAMLELSRLFAAVQPTVTVRFVAFANEEPPFFMSRHQGSVVYAKAARARGDDIRLMISLETVGYYSDDTGSQHYPPLFRFFYPDVGSFIGFVSDFRSRRLMRLVANRFRATSDFPLQEAATFSFVPGVAWSDHRSFWRQGYRAFMVTDTAFYRYRFYHTEADTPDRLSYPQFAGMTQGLYFALLWLARSTAEDW